MKPDIEAEIIALGWSTETTTANRMRAFQGSDITPTKATGWHDTWGKVLAEIKTDEIAMRIRKLKLKVKPAKCYKTVGLCEGGER